MNKQTKRLFLLTIILVFSNWTNAISLQEDTIKDYIDHALEQFLGIGNEYDPLAYEDIGIIRERVIDVSIKPTLWERVARNPIGRSPEKLQGNIQNGIINFVEEQSYKVAFEKTNNVYIATKVSNNMHNIVVSRLKTTSEFKKGCLGRFVGIHLRNAIYEQCSRFDTVHNTTPMHIIKCRICYDKFLQSECIKLTPCGHFVCTNCAQQYFFEQNKASHCPRCAKPIEIDELQKRLYGSSEVNEKKRSV